MICNDNCTEKINHLKTFHYSEKEKNENNTEHNQFDNIKNKNY